MCVWRRGKQFKSSTNTQTSTNGIYRQPNSNVRSMTVASGDDERILHTVFSRLLLFRIHAHCECGWVHISRDESGGGGGGAEMEGESSFSVQAKKENVPENLHSEWNFHIHGIIIQWHASIVIERILYTFDVWVINIIFFSLGSLHIVFPGTLAKRTRKKCGIKRCLGSRKVTAQNRSRVICINIFTPREPNGMIENNGMSLCVLVCCVL